MIAELQKKAQQLLTENASAIMTAGGVVGTVGTAVLAGRAGFKAGKIVAEANYDRLNDDEEDVDLITVREALPLVWPQFLPPVGLGVATIASIIMANRISATRAAALAAAYGISQNQLEEYKAKTLEKLGVNKEQKLRDEIAQDQVTKNPPDSQVVIISGGDVLFYDSMTGRYFQSTVENIKKAENRINWELMNHQYASLSMFFEEIDLAPTNFSDEVGWNQIQDERLEIQFSTTTTPDQKPCMVIDYNVAPHPEYTQLY